jgi:hypothetical protein
MRNHEEIHDELKELGSCLTGRLPETTYRVSEGYFEGLAQTALSRIRALQASGPREELEALSPFLSQVPRSLPFQVPEGYFEALHRAMAPDPSPAAEIRTLSPLLAGLKKDLPFEVPAGYFDGLAADHAAKESGQEALLVSLSERRWFRYAAAAIVTGIIFITGFLFIQNEGTDDSGEMALTQMTKDLRKLTDTQQKDLIDFLDAGLDGTETARNDRNDLLSGDVQQLLQDLSPEELSDLRQQTEDLEGVLQTP